MQSVDRSAPSAVSPWLLVLSLWLVSALAFAVTSWLIPGMDVEGGFFAYLWVSALFGLVNAAVGLVLQFVPPRFGIAALGLLAVLVNAIMLAITDALTSRLTIDEFWWTAIWASIVLAMVLVLLQLLVLGLLVRRAEPRAA
jgi:putative membrane protein